MTRYLSVFCSIMLMTGCVGMNRNFSTDGNGIRNCIRAEIEGNPVLYISELNGALSCYTLGGQKLWRNPSLNPAVLFDLEAADVDGDGSDDVLAASGDGHVYAWKSDGSLLWKFYPGTKVRLSEVEAIGSGDEVRVFTGGNNFKLYEVDSTGRLVSETPITGTVRKIEGGNFCQPDKQSLFLFTLKHDKYSSEFFGFIDPKTRKVIKSASIKEVTSVGSKIVNDIAVSDINKDGRDDVLFFASRGGATMSAVNGDLKEIATFSSASGDHQRYAHAIGTSLLPVKDEIVMQLGGVLYRIDSKGNLLSRSGTPHRGIIYNDLLCASGTLIGAGEVGGGNGLYFYDLDQFDWWDAGHENIGRHQEVEQNLEMLYQQVLNYKLPAYQKKSDKPYCMLMEVPEIQLADEMLALEGGDVKFINQYKLSENTERSGWVEMWGDIALKKDSRKPYDMTREEIVAWARKQEAAGTPFAIWAGHGHDPFYLRIETMEQILEVAPTTCYGFLYAEMSKTHDPRVIHFVREYVPRLAKAIRKHKSPAKLYFRYKNMFWAADCHTDLWRELFLSNQYNDILVPAAEDTNSRLQELNFAGRVGLFAGGYVNDYAMRLVDDNATSWRPVSPGGQRSVSPYLRNGALIASCGGRYGVLFNIQYLENPGFNMLFALMKSGILPIVEREDILSIGSWHLIQELDEEYLLHTSDGHNLTKYTEHDEDAVVSVAGVNWSGATVPDHDYSKVSLGVNYRWVHFMPEMPNGMVPVAPVETASRLDKRGELYCISDLKAGRVNGKQIPAQAFGPVMKQIVQDGGRKMLLKVSGASWSLIRLDAKHARLVLVDPGYIDPRKREVTVSFQHKNPLQATDILSREELSVTDGKMRLTVPAGSLRFVDLEYADEI